MGPGSGTSTTASGARHAFLWTSADDMVELNNKVTIVPAWLELIAALAISDNGQIAADSPGSL
ncbi:hypothetical protein [Cupriavidus numazuensis]|uniref:hypothetical protein n=1 Tax=Cupriavidus numazuensis TaxID=221992 RepID=UPI001BA81793|nr:hypothetical protein [Cupriavidus numazuensis]